MSSHDQALVSIVSQLALSFDGAVLGVALAYAAVRSFLKFTDRSKALTKVRNAPVLNVSDLRSLLDAPPPLSHQDQNLQLDRGPSANASTSTSCQKLVIVRGQVEAKSVVDGSWMSSLMPTLLVSHESGDKAVVIQRTQTCLYNEWKGFLSWTSDIRAIFVKSWRDKESTTLRTVPFVLLETGRWPQSEYVAVNMDGSRHPLPLTTVYHHLQPIDASPYTFLQALFGHEYPVGLLDEEKILPVGKEITAIGMCSSRNGTPEITSCKDLPYFLSEMSKDEMVMQLALTRKVLMWSGIVLGSVSVGILGYALRKNWNRWKEQRQRRQQSEESSSEISEVESDEDVGEVEDGQLCVICLTRRRRSAFIPCGHLVCCQNCAISVEREASPKCPLCRQLIRNSIRIFDS
ncbi:E3 ubiquitin-protein ligase SPL2 [Linum grandiflorum]